MNYFDKPGMSASLLKQGAKSMLHMHYAATHPMTPTPAMLRGTMMHEAILEPEKFGERIVYGGDKRKKEYKDLKAQYGAENIITPEEKDEMIAANEQVMNHPVVVEQRLFQSGEAEVERFWDCDHGPCKAKIDWLSDDYMIEYKTTNSLDGFERSAYGLNYHLQLAWYWYGSGQKQVYVVAQESRAPFDVAVFMPWQIDLEKWHVKCLDIYEQYNTGEIVGAHPVAICYELPAWADQEESLDLSE